MTLTFDKIIQSESFSYPKKVLLALLPQASDTGSKAETGNASYLYGSDF